MTVRSFLTIAILTLNGCQKEMEEGPQFDSAGMDATTYAPFILHDARHTEWRDVRLEFSDWAWLQSRFGETLDGYYFNGPGIEGLFKASRYSSGLAVDLEGIHYNSEGDTCYVHFESMAEAVKTAELAASMISSRKELVAMIAIARQNGWDDG